nr:interphotoreceptor matrix proteoglycan 2-like [Paramormyrops kingsleyae]
MNATFSSEVTEEPQSTSTTQEDENIQVAVAVTKEISTEATSGAGPGGAPDDTLGFSVESGGVVTQDVIPNVLLELGIEITPNGTRTSSEMPVRVVSQSSLAISSKVIPEVTMEVSPEVIPEKTVGVTQKVFSEVPAMNTQKDVTSEGTWEAIVMQNVTTEATQNAVAAVKFGAVIATPGMTVKYATAGLESVIEDENTITNEIDGIAGKPVQHQTEQLLELSVQLKGGNYDDALRDPSSSAYHLLGQQFAEKIEDAFETLPGFKEAYILEFRKQKNYRGRDAVVAHYAITLDASSGGISHETTDYIDLLSNSVEESYPKPDEHPAVFHTVMDFLNYVAEALHKENLIGNSVLDVDVSSLQLESVRTVFSGASRPTGGPLSSNDFMDLVLTAEKPRQEVSSSNVLVSGFGKDSFLFDHMDFSDIKTGSHALDSRTNEVIVSEESPTQLPRHFSDKPFDLKAGYISSV